MPHPSIVMQANRSCCPIHSSSKPCWRLPLPTLFTIFCSTRTSCSAMASSRDSPRYRAGSWRAIASASRASAGVSGSWASSLAPTYATGTPSRCCQCSALRNSKSSSSMVRQPTWFCLAVVGKEQLGSGWQGARWPPMTQSLWTTACSAAPGIKSAATPGLFEQCRHQLRRPTCCSSGCAAGKCDSARNAASRLTHSCPASAFLASSRSSRASAYSAVVSRTRTILVLQPHACSSQEARQRIRQSWLGACALSHNTTPAAAPAAPSGPPGPQARGTAAPQLLPPMPWHPCVPHTVPPALSEQAAAPQEQAGLGWGAWGTSLGFRQAFHRAAQSSADLAPARNHLGPTPTRYSSRRSRLAVAAAADSACMALAAAAVRYCCCWRRSASRSRSVTRCGASTAPLGAEAPWCAAAAAGAAACCRRRAAWCSSAATSPTRCGCSSLQPSTSCCAARCRSPSSGNTSARLQVVQRGEGGWGMRAMGAHTAQPKLPVTWHW